jgi:nucleotide-binding universal stress UspA family protein
MERTASDPQRSSRTLTQRSSYLNVDSTWFEKQSANLIMNALSRTGTPSVSRPSTPQPSEDKWSKKSSHHHKDHKDHKEKNDLTAKPTAGALAALGFRAAAVAGPTISPASPVEDRKIHVPKPSKANKTFLLPSRPVGGLSSPAEDVRPSRSPSPFFRARRSREERRAREKSPEITALRKDSIPGAESAAESDGEGIIRGRGAGGSGPFRPQASAYESPDDSGDDSGPGPMTEDEHDDDHSDLDTHDDDDDDHHLDDHHDGDDEFDDDDDDFFDEQTKENTEANAIYDAPSCKPDGDLVKPASGDGDGLADTFDVYGEEVEQDVLGEGPNVVVPPEPMFQAPTVTGVKRRTSKKGLELVTSRPAYARDRCTINITQGDPDGTLDKSGKRMRRYVVLSDLSEESRYAVEWAVGTVARDGDELFLISVVEDEGKVDPKSWSSKDQQTKLKVQKERQTIASLLVRQVTSLLSRTRLNVTVTCQALHAKNARYMLLDLIDFLEPTLVIVGSRGLGQLKGLAYHSQIAKLQNLTLTNNSILLGSTSHYLVQKSSVPVMVARRRMYRPLRSTDPEQLRHSPRVSLASANIEKAASKKQEDDIVDAADADNVDVQVHEVREEAEDQGIKQH